MTLAFASPPSSQSRLDISAGLVAMRVVYSDTDAMGVVYHARYLDLAERSRTLLMTVAGLDLAQIEDEFAVLLMVNRLRAEYRRAARLHETVEIRTALLREGAAQLVWRSAITTPGGLCVIVDVSTVCFDRVRRLPVALPATVATVCHRLPRVRRSAGRIDFVIDTPRADPPLGALDRDDRHRVSS